MRTIKSWLFFGKHQFSNEVVSGLKVRKVCSVADTQTVIARERSFFPEIERFLSEWDGQCGKWGNNSLIIHSSRYTDKPLSEANRLKTELYGVEGGIGLYWVIGEVSINGEQRFLYASHSAQFYTFSKAHRCWDKFFSFGELLEFLAKEEPREPLLVYTSDKKKQELNRKYQFAPEVLDGIHVWKQNTMADIEPILHHYQQLNIKVNETIIGFLLEWNGFYGSWSQMVKFRSGAQVFHPQELIVDALWQIHVEPEEFAESVESISAWIGKPVVAVGSGYVARVIIWLADDGEIYLDHEGDIVKVNNMLEAILRTQDNGPMQKAYPCQEWLDSRDLVITADGEVKQKEG